MKKKYTIAAALVLAMNLSACGETKDNSINVFRADQIMNAGQLSDRYIGMVVSENTIKIQKDSSKAIDELYVEEGQKVEEGDRLFSYDTNELDIQLDKANLSLEQSYALRNNYKEEKAEYQKKYEETEDKDEKIQYDFKIKELNTEIEQIGYTIKGQEKEVANIKSSLSNVVAKAPAAGTIKKIDESGQSGAYITIQQDGAYKVKGLINEMSMGSGLTQSSRVKIISRIDANKQWYGKVTNIDLQGGNQANEGESMGGNADPMASSTVYPFFVELEDTSDLLLGQHVYIELIDENAKPGLWIPNYFVMEETSSDNSNTINYIWVANANDKIERREVEIGAKDEELGNIEIVSGLSADEYIADPKNKDIKAGVTVSYRNASDFDVEDNEMPLINEEELFNEELEENIELNEENIEVMPESLEEGVVGE